MSAKRRYELDINGRQYSIRVRDFSAGRAELEINGECYIVDVHDVIGESAPRHVPAVTAAPHIPDFVPVKAPPQPARRSGTACVRAPIPGQVTALLVSVGDAVVTGQPLLKMEAMKMENAIRAAAAGTVASIAVQPGEAVSQGEVVLEIVT